MRTNDIINPNLPAELVVLSACTDGLGQEIGRRVGWHHQRLLYAGAARVVAACGV
ncbi:MAG: CHAT domain-containing protein [Acidobacteria bacterium]|nr:CHAT domain-containing protein [Acidobacteriota bacterium]